MPRDSEDLRLKKLLAALDDQPFTDEDMDLIFGKVQARIDREAVAERNRDELRKHLQECLGEKASDEVAADPIDFASRLNEDL